MDKDFQKAAEMHVKLQYPMGVEKEYPIADFIAGAKFAQEKMYSEEEILDVIKARDIQHGYCTSEQEVDNWFNQFKK